MLEIEALELVKTWADEEQGSEDDFLFLYENTDIRDLVKYLQDK